MNLHVFKVGQDYGEQEGQGIVAYVKQWGDTWKLGILGSFWEANYEGKKVFLLWIWFDHI